MIVYMLWLKNNRNKLATPKKYYVSLFQANLVLIYVETSELSMG